MINYKVAAAVSAAIGLSSLGVNGVARAAAPTYAACQAIEATGGDSADRLVFMAGSSAAQNGFSLSIGNDYFGGVTNLTIIKTGGNLNFQAYCGTTTASGPFGAASTNVLVYYRAEGGSVTGLLPIAAQANHTATGKIQQLKLAGTPAADVSCSQPAGSANTCTITANTAITGTSTAQGPTDSYGGTGVWTKYVDIGVTDVEPGQFGPTGPNYPTAYSATVYGSMTTANITSVPKTVGFQQAFGLFVNPTGLNSTGGTIDLSTSTVLDILNGTFSDWANVPLGSGSPAASGAAGSHPIYWVNRENGSGSKASTGIFFLGAGCGGKSSLPATGNLYTGGAAGLTDGWSTKEVLLEVSTQAGSLGYASIDNAGSVSGTALVTLNGLAPTNLLSATSDYPFLFESWYTFNPAGNNQDGQGTAAALWTAITGTGEFVNVQSAPHSAQVSAIPGKGAAPVGPNPLSANVNGSLSTVGGKTIYIGAYTRGGNSCSALLQDTH
jgi:hypothetical protein